MLGIGSEKESLEQKEPRKIFTTSSPFFSRHRQETRRTLQGPRVSRRLSADLGDPLFASQTAYKIGMANQRSKKYTTFEMSM